MSEKSFKEYEGDAKCGDRNAHGGAGWIYENGEDAPQDYEKAVYWYEKAVRQGDRRRS